MTTLQIPDDYWPHYRCLPKERFNLVIEGILNDVSRKIQDMRKKNNLDISDRIDCCIIEKYNGLVNSMVYHFARELQERCLINNLWISDISHIELSEESILEIIHPLATYTGIVIDLDSSSGFAISPIKDILKGPKTKIKIKIRKVNNG